MRFQPQHSLEHGVALVLIPTRVLSSGQDAHTIGLSIVSGIAPASLHHREAGWLLFFKTQM
jgi:hypothetical protein